MVDTLTFYRPRPPDRDPVGRGSLQPTIQLYSIPPIENRAASYRVTRNSTYESRSGAAGLTTREECCLDLQQYLAIIRFRFRCDLETRGLSA